ncbi:MAG: hypothetical protein K6A61_11905 [Butyrivibrio sp.]|nr:hypothetical protein [Butyrivibrio sp.]
MAEHEIKVTFANLSNNIAKLKYISDYLAGVNNYNDSFSESRGVSKDALSEKLKTTIAAGNALKKAVDELIADLEYAFSTFKDSDESMARAYREASAEAAKVSKAEQHHSNKIYEKKM